MLRASGQREQTLAMLHFGELLVRNKGKGKGKRKRAGHSGFNVCMRSFLAALASALAFKHALAEVG